MTSPERDGVALTHLDEPLFDGAGATKRDLVDYLDAVAELILPGAAGPAAVGDQGARRAAAVHAEERAGLRAAVDQTVTLWAESSKREVRYALCEDRRTLIWFANQRAVEYHPTLLRPATWTGPRTWCSTSTRRPAGEFGQAVAAARLVRQALTEVGLAGAVKTSGAKGVHVYVPIEASGDDAAAATRAIAERAERLDPGLATTAFIKADRAGKVFIDSTRAHGATVVAAYSPRARPGVPVSFPVPGTTWTPCPRPTSRCGPPGAAGRRMGPGRAAAVAAGAERRTSWRRATRSRSPGYRPCTRASGGSGPSGVVVGDLNGVNPGVHVCGAW